MSLDVYLEIEDGFVLDMADPGIPIRENGAVKMISREEWDERFPDREPIVPNVPVATSTVYWANITHNLNKMAYEAGIYEYLWRPDEIGIETAGSLIVPLRDGLAVLLADPTHFRQFNPPNGWGTYEGLVDFVRDYLAACEKYPAAKIRVWR